MFTGLITDIGEITETRTEGDLTLRIAPMRSSSEAVAHYNHIILGESIACSGCCLTVTVKGENWFEVQLSQETLNRTAPRWIKGTRLNLERALKAGDRLGGHFVTGHVDGLARIVSITASGDSHILTLESPEELKKFVAAKGSVTLDGVSLTVNQVENARFTVNIIPHTWQATTLSARKAGDALNMEVDLIARYLARINES